MEVQYKPKGPKGKQCRDCNFFQADSKDPSKGKCFGHDVVAGGSCNMFVSK
jgi:hypothetical protein